MVYIIYQYKYHALGYVNTLEEADDICKKRPELKYNVGEKEGDYFILSDYNRLVDLMGNYVIDVTVFKCCICNFTISSDEDMYYTKLEEHMKIHIKNS